MRPYEVAHVDDLDAIPLFHGLLWRPIRRRFEISAFGVNAYTAEEVGGQVVEEHDETGSGAGGHQELYFVLQGRATFTVDGEDVAAPAGTIVFLEDPALKRKAIADEDETIVLAVGGDPEHPFETSPWEHYFAALPATREERWEEALVILRQGLRQHPDNPSTLYNLACIESRAGLHLDALLHLQRAVALKPEFRPLARSDTDFAAIQREPGFPA